MRCHWPPLNSSLRESFAKKGVVPEWQSGNDVVRAGGVGGSADLGLRNVCVAVPERDALGRGFVVAHGLLKQHGYARSQLVRRQAPQVDAIEQDAARTDRRSGTVVSPACFYRSRSGPQKRSSDPRGYRARSFNAGLEAPSIAEGDVLETDAGLKTVRQRGGPIGDDQRGPEGEELKRLLTKRLL